MRKLFREKADKILKLSGDDHKHLSLVLRARPGEEVTIATGDGFDYIYTIDSITRLETVLKLTGKRGNVTEPGIELTLFTAVLKGDKNETVARAATELGVTKICPIHTEFTAAASESYKVARIRKIAEEAAKQSGRGRVPEVSEPSGFNEVLKILPDFDLTVFPYEHAEDADIKTFLRERFLKSSDIKKVAAIVGSEGGFSAKEAAELTALGIMPLTLGKRILRADTACATVCALILYEAGEMK